eukprot:6452722-Pyramimonas_sp.AAC.1
MPGASSQSASRAPAADFSASRGPRRASGPEQDGSGRKTGPGEEVGRSGARVSKRSGRRMSGNGGSTHGH